jgi:hypothetical protein
VIALASVIAINGAGAFSVDAYVQSKLAQKKSRAALIFN